MRGTEQNSQSATTILDDWRRVANSALLETFVILPIVTSSAGRSQLGNCQGYSTLVLEVACCRRLLRNAPHQFWDGGELICQLWCQVRSAASPMTQNNTC